MDYSTSLFGQRRFQFRGANIFVFVFPFSIEIPVLNANSVGRDQTPQIAASDLDLHYLPVPLSWDSRHKLVKCMVK